MGPALTPRRLLARLSLGVCVVLAGTLGVSLAWIAIGGGPLGPHGLIAMSLGIAGTAALAWALMALAFRSSRDGWDERSSGPVEPDKP